MTCLLCFLLSLPTGWQFQYDLPALFFVGFAHWMQFQYKFYDRKHDLYEAALLTRCYTQHALRPYIDSEINHIRHFIKIPFINKGIEFIDLPSIFRDNNVISAIPSYFENTESPIICYKYNKSIRNTILNFNKLVSDLDIETSSPDS